MSGFQKTSYMMFEAAAPTTSSSKRHASHGSNISKQRTNRWPDPPVDSYSRVEEPDTTFRRTITIEKLQFASHTPAIGNRSIECTSNKLGSTPSPTKRNTLFGIRAQRQIGRA